MLAFGVKTAFGVIPPLPYDPPTELVVIDGIRRRDAGVTMAFDVLLQHSVRELPGGGALLDEAHIESAGEIGVEPHIPGHPQAITSMPPAGIGWNWEWDDDDDDGEQTATWECPAGCSITFEDNY